jgi:hypothetical protein
MSYYLHASLAPEEHQTLVMFLNIPKFTGEPDPHMLQLLELGFLSQRVDGLILSGLGRARLQLGLVRSRHEQPPLPPQTTTQPPLSAPLLPPKRGYAA